MADSLHLTIVSPTRLVFDGQASLVEVPGAEGDMGVLPKHAPTLSMLREGIITVHGLDRSVSRYAVKGGYADITPTGCTILAESIEAA
jgi:F-type H+-transporting ATPase subunit epsilon